MKVVVKPSQLKGTVQAPASKSSMQRACALALLRRGESRLLNPGHSNDDKAAIEIIKALGASVTVNKDEVIIVSNGIQPVKPEIHCGESGLSIRMFTPLAALSDQEIKITGSGSLLSRPMDFFDEVLPQLGVQTRSNQGRLPLEVKGPLQARDIEIDGSLSSQFLTGLLMAYSIAARKADQEQVTITVRNLKSKPYIALTLDVVKKFGLGNIRHENLETFYFSGKNQAEGSNASVVYEVEGDWSGGAFLLVAGALAGPVTIHGLDIASPQGDKAILDALMSAHAGVAIEAKGIKIHPAPLKAFEFDATDCPDLFPPLVALAAYSKGDTYIRGVQRLIHKESNRAVTLQEEFGKMGVPVTWEEDVMKISGGAGVKGADVFSHHDHRIAMACAVAALKAEGETTIREAGAASKSYPDFYAHLKQLGAAVSLPYQIIN